MLQLLIATLDLLVDRDVVIMNLDQGEFVV
jgi:hypothetical protein